MLYAKCQILCFYTLKYNPILKSYSSLQLQHTIPLMMPLKIESAFILPVLNKAGCFFVVFLNVKMYKLSQPQLNLNSS